MIVVFHQGEGTEMDPSELLGPFEGGYDNDNETTRWYEGYLCKCHGDVVKKSLSITLKRQPSLFGEVGNVGG